ncbi:hypothetical protein BGX38DRAFT_1191249 [Terfezia claveryi]|nr:hypothetical protein BGX38DRAFT_1191249 [Terfezia claveryi]
MRTARPLAWRSSMRFYPLWVSYISPITVSLPPVMMGFHSIRPGGNLMLIYTDSVFSAVNIITTTNCATSNDCDSG